MVEKVINMQTTQTGNATAQQVINSIIAMPMLYKALWILIALTVIGMVLSGTVAGILLMLCSAILIGCIAAFLVLMDR